MFAFTLRQIEVFLVVCEAGSFRRAADALGMTEAGVSNHMRLLEEQLGLTLFKRRRGSSIGITETGHDFREEATAFVKFGIELGRRGRKLEAPVKLRFYVGDHIREDFVRPALPAFLRDNPDIDLSFTSIASREDVARAIHAGELDGALFAVQGEADMPSSELVGEVGSGIYATPEIASLVEQQGFSAPGYLLSALNVSGGGWHENALRQWGVEHVRVAGRYPYHDVGVRMALEGVGAIMILDSIIEKFDQKRELVCIKRTGIWQRRLYISPNIEADRARRIRRFFLSVLA